MTIAVALVSFAALTLGGAIAAVAFGLVPIAIIAVERRAHQQRESRGRTRRNAGRAEIISWRGR